MTKFALLFRIGPKIRYFFYLYFNRFIFRINGAIFGKNLRIVDRFYLKKRDRSVLKIGDNFTFSSGDGYNPLSRNIRGMIFIDEGAELHIGDNSGISSACIWAKEKVVIGNEVLIGGDCLIIDTDAHNLDWRVRTGKYTDENGNKINDIKSAASAPIIIEDNVLIGTRCIILKGVTIGKHAIIAAGSVVTKSIPANCVAGGNPCRVIRINNEGE